MQFQFKEYFKNEILIRGLWKYFFLRYTDLIQIKYIDFSIIPFFFLLIIPFCITAATYVNQNGVIDNILPFLFRRVILLSRRKLFFSKADANTYVLLK